MLRLSLLNMERELPGLLPAKMFRGRRIATATTASACASGNASTVTLMMDLYRYAWALSPSSYSILMTRLVNWSNDGAVQKL